MVVSGSCGGQREWLVVGKRRERGFWGAGDSLLLDLVLVAGVFAWWQFLPLFPEDLCI